MPSPNLFITPSMIYPVAVLPACDFFMGWFCFFSPPRTLIWRGDREGDLNQLQHYLADR
jgi:hypothetical protein